MKKINNPKIGIIGIGMVGSVLKKCFQLSMREVFLYDKYKQIGSVKEINLAEIIFVCVPTPFNKKSGGYDSTAVEEAFRIIKGEKVIVIKSTILPGSTEKLQKKYPQHKILFNPEFLRELTAYRDMTNPDEQIIGYTLKSKQISKEILKLLPRAPFEAIIPSVEAELVKYFINSFLSVKVIFANQMYDLCQALRIDYNRIKECATADSRLGHSHLDIFYSGARGYFGKCLPKDMRALIQRADEAGVDLKLLKMAEKINNNLLKKQKIYKIMEDVDEIKKIFKKQ